MCSRLRPDHKARIPQVLFYCRDGHLAPVEDAGGQDGVGLRHAQHLRKVFHFARTAGRNHWNGDGVFNVLDQFWGRKEGGVRGAPGKQHGPWQGRASRRSTHGPWLTEIVAAVGAVLVHAVEQNFAGAEGLAGLDQLVRAQVPVPMGN